ncbi:MAG: hypothetical protein HC862_09065 [Scytonema sp. RU_4_4]|nr:hypothetical protein [Scytonema sp. RU_4_4]
MTKNQANIVNFLVSGGVGDKRLSNLSPLTSTSNNWVILNDFYQCHYAHLCFFESMKAERKACQCAFLEGV